MTKQLWARGVWGVAVAVACSAAAIGAQQTPPGRQIRGPQTSVGQQGQNGQPNQNGQATQQNWKGAQNPAMAGAGRTDLDHYLVKVLVKANQDEIEMGKLAQQRSQNAEVKQLATQMVQDHTRFLSRLESLKKGEAVANPQAATQPQTQRSTAFRGNISGESANGPNQQQAQPVPNSQVAQQPGANNAQLRFGGKRMHRGEQFGMGGDHGTAGQFAKIMEEVDRNMQQSLVRDLSSKQGAQFNRCFLTSQLFSHMWVAEALKTFERDATPQLKPVLQEGIQATEQHLTHIKSLLAKAENEPAAAAPGARIFQPRGARINK